MGPLRRALRVSGGLALQTWAPRSVSARTPAASNSNPSFGWVVVSAPHRIVVPMALWSQRLLLPGLASLLIAAPLPGPALADATPQPSQRVALVTGTTHSLPSVPTTSFQAPYYDLRELSFDQRGTSDLATGALASYDTLLLYGVDWKALTTDQRAGVNAFARTGK